MLTDHCVQTKPRPPPRPVTSRGNGVQNTRNTDQTGAGMAEPPLSPLLAHALAHAGEGLH